MFTGSIGVDRRASAVPVSAVRFFFGYAYGFPIVDREILRSVLNPQSEIQNPQSKE